MVHTRVVADAHVAAVGGVVFVVNVVSPHCCRDGGGGRGTHLCGAFVAPVRITSHHALSADNAHNSDKCSTINVHHDDAKEILYYNIYVAARLSLNRCSDKLLVWLRFVCECV